MWLPLFPRSWPRSRGCFRRPRISCSSLTRNRAFLCTGIKMRNASPSPRSMMARLPKPLFLGAAAVAAVGARMRWRKGVQLSLAPVLRAWLVFCSIAVAAPWPCPAASSSGTPIDFDRDIRPILSDNCYACHGPDKDKRKAGLRLDVKADALNALESGGFAIVPGRPDQSLLLKLVSLPAEDEDRMPPSKVGKQLTKGQVN